MQLRSLHNTPNRIQTYDLRLWTPSADFEVRTVFSYNFVDQSSVSGLSKDDWRDNPEENYYHLPGRDVESFRLSTKMTKYLDNDTEINITLNP
mgnify:CR=1 FL=1